MNVNNADKPMAKKAPRNKADKPDFNKLRRPMMDANPIPMMGDIKGATNIAPMITAGEFVIKPSVAILVERMTSKK